MRVRRERVCESDSDNYGKHEDPLVWFLA